MKKVLLAIAIVTSFAACNTRTAEPAKSDLVLLSPENNNGTYSNALSDTADSEQLSPMQQNLGDDYVVVKRSSLPKTIIIRKEIVRVIHEQAPIKKVVAPSPEPVIAATADQSSNNDYPVETTEAPVPVVKEKKGWSNAAKGAVLGGVGGAIGGAVISKNKGKGAVIGGVLGAAGGYIFGKSKDKKETTENNVVAVKY